MEDSLVPAVHSLVVLDSEGERILVKYYDKRPVAEQTAFEATLQKKTKNVPVKVDAEAILIEHEVVVFRSSSDVKFFVSGALQENELILVAVLDAVCDAVTALLRGQVDKRNLLESLELVLLVIDEVIDHGHIFELDSNNVCARALMRAASASSGFEVNPQQSLTSGQGASTNSQPTSVGDLTISQAFNLARKQLLGGRGEY